MRLNIDGKIVTAKEGMTVLDAARSAGFYIPTLCYHYKTGPAGKCRMCVVEIEGFNGLQTSCTVKASDGMVVKTKSDKVIAAQRLIADELISTGAHDCLACSQNGECELMDVCYYLGIERPSLRYEDPVIEIDDSSEFIRVDRSKCILCGRCVVACNDVVVHNVLQFEERGSHTKIIFDDDKPMGVSSCVQCGECVQVCPVECLYDKKARGNGRYFETKKVKTVCPYCGVGCQTELHIKDNKIVKIYGVEGAPASDGMLCIKGRYAYNFVSHPDRLKTPLIKENGKFREATWNEALELVANKLSDTKEKYSADSIVGFASAKATNEDNYIFQKFMRAIIGTNNVDHCARLCHSSTVGALMRTVGSGAMTNDISGMKESDVAMFIGANSTETHPVISYQIKKARKERGMKIIVIDPMRTKMVDHADIFAQIKLGTDVAVLNGIMRVIITEDLADKNFIRKRTEGYQAFKDEVMKYTPELVEEISGVPARTIIEIGRMFGSAKVGACYHGMGITQHTMGVDNALCICNLQMLCGNLGIVGGGINPLRGQCNVQGASDMAGLPDIYPGYQPVTNKDIQEKFEKAWGVKLSDKSGYPLTDAMDCAYTGDVKAIYIMGENPMVSDPDLQHVEETLKKLDFLVVQDIFLTETAELADVVLPAFCYAEKDGTFTNTERRVQRLRKAVDGPGISKDDWEIVQLIANKMGAEWNYTSSEEIFDEICAVTPSMAGMDYDRIDKDGLCWPCTDKKHPGSPVLHKESFPIGNGKGKMHPVSYKGAVELPDDEYPYYLTTGRVLQQYHTGTMTRKDKGIDIINGPHATLNPDDAKVIGVHTGDMIKITSRRGDITTKVVLSKAISEGNVFVPFHYAEAAANMLTKNALDPISRIPEYKISACKIEKA